MNLLEMEQVSLHYGALTALDSLSLTLAEGEVLGLFGHNGAGKTTSMKIILGLLQPSSGQIRVSGESPQHHSVRRQLGYLPENVMFYPQLSGRETLRHFARLKNIPLTQVDDLLERVGLSHALNRRVKTYSKGMRQRLGLAQALLGKPRLLLLDEPTVGLDPIATQQLYQIVDELRRGGTGIILCSHVLPGVEPYINRAAILAGGRLQAIGTLRELRQQVDLPTRIRLHSSQGLAFWQQHWPASDVALTPVGHDCLELYSRGGHTSELLRHCLQQQADCELEVSPPSLDDLYLHYMHATAETH